MRGDPSDPSLPRERPERDPSFHPAPSMTDGEAAFLRAPELLAASPYEPAGTEQAEFFAKMREDRR